MTPNRLAATLRGLAQEAHALHDQLRDFLESDVSRGISTAGLVESALPELDRLARRMDALATLVELR